jgi:flagellar basal-body rod protein FlgC
MSSDLSSVFSVASSGLKAQTTRMKVVAENIANADTTPSSPTQQPYRRQVVTFENEFDKVAGAYQVKVAGVKKDRSDFNKKFDPSHPAADAQGFVLTPNVNAIMESMDMRQAQRSYDANLNVIDAARGMMLKTIDLLKSS